MGLFDFTTKLFGNKYDKDLKEINPVIDKIKATSPDKISGILSHWPVENKGKKVSKPPWLSFINSIKNLTLNKVNK